MVRTSLRALAAVAVLATTSALVLGTSTVANAAPGDAFDPAKPMVYIVQGAPSQLQTAEADSDGNVVFTVEGAASAIQYNALSYRTADNYLYGFATTGDASIPTGSLVKVGQGGVISRVGTGLWSIPGGGGTTSFNLGTIGADGYLYASYHAANQMYVINPATGTEVVPPITLSKSMQAAGDVSDWTFSSGFLWGLGASRNLVRVNPATGNVDEWTLTDSRVDTGFSGASWTYLDGSVGFSHNVSGKVERIEIENPGAATPVFTVVRAGSGPASDNNDGAASPGLPADLALAKTSSGFAPGATVTYDLTVTNKGAGWSTGWTVEDSIPAALTNITATSTAVGVTCSVTGQNVLCTGGELAPSAKASITVTAAVPADQTEKVKNSAKVTGNDPDPNPTNNNASVVDAPDAADPVVPDPADEPVLPATGAPADGSAWLKEGGLDLAGLGLLVVAFGARRKRIEQ